MTTENTFETIELKRTGLPPIRFAGREIGCGSTRTVRGEGQNRWTNVRIYRSKAGKWLVHVEAITCWEGETDHRKAGAFDSAGTLIEWLTDDNGGELGRASQEACEMAAKSDPEFAAAFVEEIE